MAKKPKKVPEAEGEGGEADAPKSKKKLIVIAAAVLLLGGGGGGYMVMKKKAAAAESEHGAHADVKMPAVFVDVRDMLVNLSADPGQTKVNTLKLRIALELKDAKVEAEVKPLMPRVEDAFQTYLREIRASDLAGSAGLYRLREELLRRVNIAIHPAKVEAVLFKDVIVQ